MAEKTSTAAQTSEPGAKGARRESPPPALLGLAGSFLDLQSTVGNRGVGRLLGGALLQPKLRIGPAGDAYEREADRVADAVLGNGPAVPISEAGGGIQRICAECQKEEEEGLVQRMCSECQEEQEEEDLLQPKAEGVTPATASTAFETRLGSLRRSGRPLPADLRSFFEPRFGHDFGAVRVHTGGAAGEAAQAVSARAFTVGNDVVFGAGEWSPGSTAGRRLLAHELTHVVQQTPQVARRKPLLQRAPQEASGTAPEPETPAPEQEAPAPTPEPAPSPGEPPSEAAPAAALIVEDDATEVGEGQMKKSEFLARLRPAVLAAAEASLSDQSRAQQASSLLELWLDGYVAKDAEQINSDLQRLVPSNQRPTTAEDCISAVAERVRTAIATWEKTGELPLSGSDLPGARGLLGGLGGVFFKALPGGPRDPGNPRTLRAQLGAGRPLDGGVRSRMESAFGCSFAHVQVHTDGRAAGLSHHLNARAFTIGSHVAFGAGEYQPGTLVGDALVAHELAHVAQQGGAAESVQPMRSDNASYGALERDADMAAVGAVASLWGLRLPKLRLPLKASPRLSSGLRLQRCDSCNERLAHTVTQPPVDHGCGGFEMAARFRVDNANQNTNGFIVQKLTFDLQRESCGGGANNFQKTYWEAWEVRKGVVYIGTSKSQHNADTFSVPPTPDHRGNNYEEGRAKYIPDYKEPYTWGNVPEARSLPATTNPPPGWSDNGTTHRWIRSEFDCCPSKKKPKFSHQA